MRERAANESDRPTVEPKAPPERRRRRHTTLALLLAGLALVAAAGLALFGDRGQRALGAFLARQVNAKIAGRVEVERIGVGLAGIRIEGIAVHAPGESEVAIALQRLELAPAIDAGLLHGTLRLHDVRLQGVRVHLDGDATGTNLARAFAPRSPATTSDGGSGWEIVFDRLAIADGALRARTDGVTRVELRGLELTARGRVDPEGARIAGVAEAILAAPRGGGVRLELDGTIDGGWRSVDLRRADLHLGESTLAFAGEGDLDGEATVRDLHLHLAPADAAIVFPGWKPTVPLRAEGSATLVAGEIAADLAIVPQGAGSAATLTVQGRVAPLGGGWELRVDGRALDPRSLDARAPAGRIDLCADLRGTGAGAEGAVELRSVQIGATKIGPVVFEGAWQGETLVMRRLQAALPGAQLRANGRATAARGDVRFDLEARDLHRLLRAALAMSEALGIEALDLPDLRGDLRIEGRIAGRWNAPSIDARLAAGALHWGAWSAADLRLEAALDDPVVAQRGRVQVDAARLDAGGTRLAGLRAALRLEGSRLSGDLRAQTPAGPLRAALDVDRDRWRSLRVRRLDLRAPRTRWTIDRPFVVSFVRGVEVRDVSLRGADGARIEFGGRLVGRAVDAAAEVEKLSLAELPPAIAPETLALGGRLDLHARLSGSIDRPQGSVEFEVREGALLGASGIAIDGALQLDGEAARATLAASRGDARLAGWGESAWPPNASSPIEAELRLDGLDLASLQQPFALDPSLAGSVHGKLALHGSFADPRGAIELRGENLGAFGLRDVAATLQATFSDAVSVELEAVQGGARLSAAARADGRLADGPGLIDAPLDARIQATGWPLEAIAGAATDEAISGGVGIDAAISGSLRAPRGDLRLDLREGRSGDVGPLDAAIALHVADAESRISIDTHLLGRPFLSGELAAGAPIERLFEPAGRARASLSGTLTARDLEVGALAWAAGFRRRAAGLADGTLRIGGTLDAPTLDLDAELRRFSLARIEWGDLRIDAGYDGRTLTATVDLRARAGGSARLEGRWFADLAPPAIAAGSLGELAAQPLDLAFEARHLDLDFVSSLSSTLHHSEGKLDGALRIGGALPTPRVEGALALRDGRIGAIGYGELRDVEFALELAPDAIHLRRFEATAGGSLLASGAAIRNGPKDPWRIEGEVLAERFTITTSDLVRGWLDLKAAIRGEADTEGLDLRVALQRTRLRLADTPARDVQPLDPHPDFVFVREGAERTQTPKGVAPRTRAFSAVVHLASEAPIEIEGADVDVDASADLKILLAEHGLEMIGSTEVEGGHVVVLGRRFELERGRLYYTGAEPPGDPRLDVAAQHKSPHAIVFVTVGGTVQRPTTRLRSQPPYSEAQIAELLATGRLQGGTASGTSGAASALGTVLATQMKKGIASKLPLDVISFEAGEDDPLAGSRLEAGSWITERIYLGYARRFEADAVGLDERERQNANEVRFEYQLAPRWTLEITYGDANVGGADLMWTRDF